MNFTFLPPFHSVVISKKYHHMVCIICMYREIRALQKTMGISVPHWINRLGWSQSNTSYVWLILIKLPARISSSRLSINNCVVAYFIVITSVRIHNHYTLIDFKMDLPVTYFSPHVSSIPAKPTFCVSCKMMEHVPR